ncbi:MAG: glycosyltransferase family 4 protein [bacterium]|nr:glycosyltransferase family 4 protein [bacterium]
MKLLMITGLGGGVDLVRGKRGAFYHTLEEFHRYWDRIDIILPKVEGVTEKQFFDNVFVHCSTWPMLYYPAWFLKKGADLHREQKFDLMTVHEFPPFYNGIGARLLAGEINVPYVLEVHHIPGHPKAGSFKEKMYKKAWKVFAKFDTAKAKAVRVVNQKETPEFLISAGVAKEKIAYIPSVYLDLEVFRVYPVKSGVASPPKAEFDGVNPEVEKKFDLVFCSRLEKNKGIFNLIEAVKIAKQKKPDIKLLIIGNGPEKNNLESRIKSYRLQENIFFSGWLETTRDVAMAYNSAKIFVNPSFNEGGPRVALEAMACGLPMVTTKVGLMHDLIRNGENGLFTDWEPSNMAETILKLLNDPALQTKFSQAGQTISQHFEKKAMIRNYAESLQKLL